MSANYLRNLTFAFAEIIPEPDGKNKRQQIEAALIYSLRQIYKKETGVALTRSNRPEELLGHISAAPQASFRFKHTGAALNAIPRDFLSISGYVCGD